MSRSTKLKAEAELAKAQELLREAQKQNLEEGQREIEAILKERGITMRPQIILRGGEQIEQIIFIPAQQISQQQAQPQQQEILSKSLQEILDKTDEEKPSPGKKRGSHDRVGCSYRKSSRSSNGVDICMVHSQDVT